MTTKNEWLAFRSQWLRDNPPNHQGYYQCYLCKKWVFYNEVTLDHVISRSRRPDLVLDRDNVRPCCYSCNGEKGSRDVHKPAFGL